MANKFEEMINKSFEEMDALADSFKKSQESNTLSKAKNDEDISPDEVSDEAPAVDDGTQSPGELEQEQGNDAPEPSDDDVPDTTEDDEDDDETYEKSLESELKGNESVSKALEVSEFLEELVKGLDTMITDRTDRISKSLIESSDSSNELLAKSIVGIAKGQKAVIESNMSILKSLNAMDSRMHALETQPTVRKSVSSASQVIEKSFDASAGNKAQATNTLSKAQASAKLMAEYEGGNTELMNDILALEGTGNLESVSDKGKHVLGLL